METVTYDETKRVQNLAKHGLDFAALDVRFFDTSIVVPAKSGRFMAVGQFDDRTIVVVFRPLGREAVAVISMRYASPKERRML